MCCEAVALIAGHHVHEAKRALVAHAALHWSIVADQSERIFRLLTMCTYCFLSFGHDDLSHKAVKRSHCLRRLRRVWGPNDQTLGAKAHKTVPSGVSQLLWLLCGAIRVNCGQQAFASARRNICFW
jgi:hypothetical protein